MDEGANTRQTLIGLRRTTSVTCSNSAAPRVAASCA